MNAANSTLSAGAALEPYEAFIDADHYAERTPVLVAVGHVVSRWRWVIAGILGAALLVGLIVSLLLAPQYTAVSQIEIERNQKEITKLQGLEANDNSEDLEFYATQYALLAARPVMARVASELDLYDSDAFFEAHGISREDATDGRLDLTDERREALVEELVLETLKDSVIIDPVRTSRLVDIGYTSRSPELSTAITNAWTGAFVRVSMDRQIASTADARRVLENRLSTLRGRVEQTERAVITYASEQDIINLERVIDDRGRTIESRTLTANNLASLNAALNSARNARISTEARLTSDGQNTSEAVNSAAVAALREREASLEAQYAQLLTQFEPEYPQAIAIKEQIEAIQTAIGQEATRIVRARQQDFREARAREQELAAQVDEAKQLLDRQQRASIQYAVLQRERDTNRQLYDALLQRYKEIGVAGTVGITNISVVEAAPVPLDPSFPNIPLNLAISLLLGSLVAGAVVFALEHIDEGLRELSQVPQLLGVPLLGYTPEVEGDILELLHDSKSEYYEANFSIHSTLSFATRDGFPKSLTVSSTQPNEGKSSVSLAMAVVLGRLGRKVLYVDGDLRSPTLQEFIDVPNGRGFSNVLAGENGWSEDFVETDFKGVSILMAGPMPPNAAELLSTDRLGKFVAEGLEHFDHVIIDSPPVLDLSDAPMLARAVEGCVFVAEAGGPPVRAVKRSVDRLRGSHAKVLGVVVTKFEDDRSSYGYGYGYGYGPDRDESDDRATV